MGGETKAQSQKRKSTRQPMAGDRRKPSKLGDATTRCPHLKLSIVPEAMCWICVSTREKWKSGTYKVAARILFRA